MPPQVILPLVVNDEEPIISSRKEILYEGYLYDVTDWISRHPGGKVIDFYTNVGEDASLAVQQFHYRSMKQVLGIMKSLKKRPAPSNQLGLSSETLKRHKALTDDFQKLHKELESEGFFKPSIPHVIYRLSELILIFAFVVYLYSFESKWPKSIAVSLLAVVCGRCGWVMHEGSHNSLTGYPKVDRFIQSMVFGIGNGCSSVWWTSQHNRHHAMPNRVNHDVDLKTLPLLAFNKEIVKNPKDGQTFFVQHQAKLFFLVDTFLVSWYWKLYLHPRYALLKGSYMDLFFMSMHYVVCLHFGFFNCLFGVWLTSVYMLGNFTLSHTHLPVTADDEPLHWVEYSLLHTTDIEPSLWCDWWMGYLNYQIGHHLFPTLPQFRHPQIRHRVKALADRHNIPYNCMSYWEALKKTVKNLEDVSHELKQMH